MSSPNQQSQSSNSRSDAQSTTRRQAKEDHEKYVEKLINDHIPHFPDLYKKKKGNIKKRKLQESSSTESHGYNTSTSYCAKQVKFLIFCNQHYAHRPLATRHQATGNKLLSFLYQKVVNRQLCKPGTKHIEESNIDNNEGLDEETIKTDAIQKKLFYSTCNVYISVIVDLWNYQRLMCFNSTESPRTKVITKLLKVVRMREANNN
ncbi:hypothetical protein BDC45DRAFT_610969 [Circinella umbellata]|nr:hypothetical protein BDC45DRAFT_610969 [Circinella umbellata]